MSLTAAIPDVTGLSLAAGVCTAAAPNYTPPNTGGDITPHTLPGASSAELDVKLWAQEDSPPNLYQSGASTANLDGVSRVARHNVMTKVRVESVKLFDVSSFSAMVQRPRSKFPLLPPFVEIPFISTLAGLPLPAAKEYHRSTAVVSALVVPTAADLAYGIEFSRDRGVALMRDSWNGHAFVLQPLVDPGQLWPMQLRAYHAARMACFATNGRIPFPGDLNATGTSCDKVTFKDLLLEP